MGARKNSLIETVLLSTHDVRFGLEIRKIIFSYALLPGGLKVPLSLHKRIYLLFMHCSTRELVPLLRFSGSHDKWY